MMWNPDWTGVLSGQPLEWMITGFITTCIITLIGSFIATTVVLLLLALRFMSGYIGRFLVIGLVSILRNTPLLIQLFFWYFAVWNKLPISWREFLLDEKSWIISSDTFIWLTPEFICSAWSLGIFSAAYLVEELHAGLNALPIGQKEAAISQGFNKRMILYYILLPQVTQNTWQPIVNHYLNLMKLSSLASAIGFTELTYYVSQIASYNAHVLEGFTIGILLYLFLGLIMSLVLTRFGPKQRSHSVRDSHEF